MKLSTITMSSKIITMSKLNKKFMDYLTLTRPRMMALVLATTAIGFFLALKGKPDWLLFFNTLFSTLLLAAGTSAINMVLEHHLDAKMERTKNRPIPSGRLIVLDGAIFGILLLVIGIIYAVLTLNLLTMSLEIITSVNYLFVYTILKPRTSLSTIFGAVSGAIPPVIGWTSLNNSLGFGATILFLILFLWQIPHFLSIAWTYREDYKAGGFPVLSVIDPSGKTLSKQIILYQGALLCVSLLPGVIGMVHPDYFFTAFLLGFAFLIVGFFFAQNKTYNAGKKLFFASIVYLPVLLLIMICYKQ